MDAATLLSNSLSAGTSRCLWSDGVVLMRGDR